jgi:hypothetical protein
MSAERGREEVERPDESTWRANRRSASVIASRYIFDGIGMGAVHHVPRRPDARRSLHR